MLGPALSGLHLDNSLGLAFHPGKSSHGEDISLWTESQGFLERLFHHVAGDSRLGLHIDPEFHLNQPRWMVLIQVMPEKDAAKYPYNPFDLTKVWFHDD